MKEILGILSPNAVKRLILFISFGLIISTGFVTEAHDVITTKITFSREISRIFYERCVSCHHEGGSAFSLLSYAEARPWAVAIKEEVLSRRMPPWGAVKGFGEFRNDQALTSEQLELITQWVEGGVPEGDAPELPPQPKFGADSKTHGPDGLVVSGDFKLDRPLKLDGLWPQKVTDDESLQIIAELPTGNVEPLLWLYEYKSQYGHPFLLRSPIDLPPGTFIHGVPPQSSIVLLPAASAPAVEARDTQR